MDQKAIAQVFVNLSAAQVHTLVHHAGLHSRMVQHGPRTAVRIELKLCYRVVGEGERVLLQGAADLVETRNGTEPEYGVHLTFVFSDSVRKK